MHLTESGLVVAEGAGEHLLAEVGHRDDAAVVAYVHSVWVTTSTEISGRLGHVEHIKSTI